MKAKELLMKLVPRDGRLFVGTAYYGQNLRTGEIRELVPAEDYLEIGVVLSTVLQIEAAQHRAGWF